MGDLCISERVCEPYFFVPPNLHFKRTKETWNTCSNNCTNPMFELGVYNPRSFVRSTSICLDDTYFKLVFDSDFLAKVQDETPSSPIGSIKEYYCWEYP